MSGTADIYTQTSLQPGKLELLAPWLQQQDWFEGDAADLERVGNFRFVDPDGEVGLDSMLLASGGRVYHVPVTWRGAELAEGELIGTLEHGVLGTRWCYDAPTDPVYVAELVRVIREGDTGAAMLNVETQEPMPENTVVAGSGVVPGVDAQGQVRLVRVLDAEHQDTHAARGVLTATWTYEDTEREDVLAVLR